MRYELIILFKITPTVQKQFVFTISCQILLQKVFKALGFLKLGPDVAEVIIWHCIVFWISKHIHDLLFKTHEEQWGLDQTKIDLKFDLITKQMADIDFAHKT